MSKKNDKVSDFEWQSAAAFFRYVEINAELIDYSLASVYSFQVTEKTGFKGLVARKLALLRILTENLGRIEKWAKGEGDSISRYQLVFVRSLYVTTKDLATMVKEQIERAELLAAHEHRTKATNIVEKEMEDELSF